MLFLFGNINAAFFTGEILVLYSIIGFVLIGVCRLSTRVVLYTKDENWKNFVLHNKGPEAWEQDKAEREMVLTEFIPYLKQHCNLSACLLYTSMIFTATSSLSP